MHVFNAVCREYNTIMSKCAADCQCRRHVPWNKGLGLGVNAREKKYRDAAKAKLEAIRLERGCVDCGYAENVDALQFDHIDPSTVVKRKYGHQAVLAFHHGDHRLDEELAKCEVRCANCHAIRTRQQQRDYWEKWHNDNNNNNNNNDKD